MIILKKFKWAFELFKYENRFLFFLLNHAIKMKKKIVLSRYEITDANNATNNTSYTVSKDRSSEILL